MTPPSLAISISRSPLRLGLLLIPLALVCFAFSPTAQAVSPPPDGGYPGDNTAEGTDALFSLTTGANNTALGWRALFSNTTGGFNTASGWAALINNSQGGANTANGYAALLSNTTGSLNTANGRNALFKNTTGYKNSASGASSLQANSAGHDNVAIGVSALANNTTGSFNIAVGSNAGASLTTGSNNIHIGPPGVAGETNTIRIGAPTRQTATFIGGIYGATVPSGVGVIVGSDGHLGTVQSSARFKDAIKPMDKASEAILALKPVTFHYKSDGTATPQFGLIAEEVAKVNPDLVVRDENGEIYTVRYDAVNAMLLNEFLKGHKKVEQQQASIAELKSTVAQQQKGMEVLTAQLKEQGAQIQKVSAQLEATKPAPQMVNNP